MKKSLHFWLTVFAVSYLVQDTLSRRMSLRAKRKKVLRQMLEKEARIRNDTVMLRLLHEQSSKYDPNDPKKPPVPKEYEDMSRYTLPPHMQPGPNESAIDNSDFVRENVEGFPSKRTPKSTTPKRNRTTSKYKKKLAERSSTTLCPEAVERLQNLTTFNFLHLTPISIEDDTLFPIHYEKLDPNYYTYRSKAWTTTNSTNSSTTGVMNTTSNLCDKVIDDTTVLETSNDKVRKPFENDYNDFDNPITRVENVDQTLGDFTSNFSKLLAIVQQYEKMVIVNGESDYEYVDKAHKNYGSRVRNLIKSDKFDMVNNYDNRINGLILNIKCVDVSTDKHVQIDKNLQTLNKKISNDVTVDNVQERNDKDKIVQYNDYNDRVNEIESVEENDGTKLSEKGGNKIATDEKKEEILEHERNNLVEDILSKYCRENPTIFENNLKKDAYYNTLKSVLGLFVKEMGGSKYVRPKYMEPKLDKIEEMEEIYDKSIEEKECKRKHKNVGDKNENNNNELVKACDNFESQEFSTMKPVIHRVNELIIDTKDVITVEMNIVTDVHESNTTRNIIDEYNQENVGDIMKDIDTNKKNDLKDIQSDNSELFRQKMSETYFENSSKNDKVIAELLLKNKLKEEIKKINILIDKVNILNGSVRYEHIKIENNASFHEIVEKLRTKRNVQLQQHTKREEAIGNSKIVYMNELIKYLEDYESVNKRKKREEPEQTTETEPQDPRKQTYDPFKEIRKPLRFRRSKSEEDYNAREAVKRGKKTRNKPQIKPELTSKEKYYYPKISTHDPGGELWRDVKRDYETDPKIRKIIDTSQVVKEELTSHMWNCKNRSPERRKKRETKSEEEYYEKEYKRKMKADHKKRVLDDESPETTEATTPDLKFLDISKSRARAPIDINDLGLSRPEEFIKQLRKRDLTNLNKDDVFQRYDPDDSKFVEKLAQHAIRNRRYAQSKEGHNRRHKRAVNGRLINILSPKFENQAERMLRNKLRKDFRRRRAVERQHHLSQENVKRDEIDYDMYHGMKYGLTEVFEGDVDLTGMYTRYTAASVGPYQKKRYEEFRKFCLDASSTFKDPFIKVSFAVCPFCGDYFGNRDKLLFHENYDHFNIFSTVVPVTHEPTATVSKDVKDKDINDIFEMILKDPDLAMASEKWGDLIDQHINPTKRMEYRNLLFNESITAFKTVPVHLGEETTEDDPNVKIMVYPSEYHLKENFSYHKDIGMCANKSIPVVNLYENPEAFLKKLVNHEPILPEDQQG